MRAQPLLFALALVASLVSSATAEAQDDNLDRSFSLEQFRPTLDADGFLTVEGSRTPGPFLWSVGVHLHWAEAPLALVDDEDNTTDLVEHSLAMDYVFALGIGRSVEVGIGLPVAVAQQGDLEALGGDRLASVGFGDMRVALKLSLIDNTNDGPGLAVVASGTLPIGDTGNFLGEGSPTIDPRVVADFKLLNIALGASLGYRLRGEVSRLKTLRAGDELLWGVGLRAPVALHGKLAFLFELFGATAAKDPFGSSLTSPMEADGGLRFALSDISVQATGGWGIGEGYGTPVFRVGGAVTWAPRTHDSDSDGIEDGTDMCPRIAEDSDDFEDGDGCPEQDNDGDGVYDFEDQCPNERAEQGRDADGDGCSDDDRDGDHVLDDADRCPDEAEDIDEHQDDDGCADPDNDQDQILDAQDRCPGEAEDGAGDATDGCPNPDDDGDGKPDAEDRCPAEAEDADGFEDDDGCPDPDNDHDGVLDAADRCADQAETINGVTDDDGCTDRGGRVLVTFADGALTVRGAIAFDRTGAPTAAAKAALDQLALVLVANPTVRIEIVGPTGEGSAARAEAVRAYVVGKGVAEGRIAALAAPDGAPANRNATIRVAATAAAATPAAAPAPTTPAPAR